MIALRSLLAPASVVGGVAVIFGCGWYVGSGIANKKHTEGRLVEMAAHSEALLVARGKEQALQSQADQIKRMSDEKITLLTTRVNGLVSELRNRPERPTNTVPADPGTEPTKCTGAGLYRDDAEFLVRFAQDADITQQALTQCRDAYNSLINKE